MAPLQSKKRKSADSNAPHVEPTAGPSDLAEGASRTPIGSPARKKMRITLSQKQALIDNLQLEITDRARRLRATYAHQALSLRSRIETRVNRIPRSLRKATMGELLAKYTETLQLQSETDNPSITAMNTITSPASSHPLPAIPQELSTNPPSPSPAKPRGVKRPSNDLVLPDAVSDKENAPHEPEEPALPNPKKRAKAAPTAARTASQSKPRAASRTAKATTAAGALQAQTSKVLSPRSPNSRTLQMSPSKTSPVKSLIARPVSPLKPASPLKATTLMVGGAVAASLAGMVEHAKNAKEKARKISPRGLAEARKEKKAIAATVTSAPSTSTRGTRKAATTTQVDDVAPRTASSSSNSSTSTTVVTKQAVAKKPTARKTVVTETKTTAKKGAAATAAAKAAVGGANKKGKEAIEMPTTGRRVLRKRV